MPSSFDDVQVTLEPQQTADCLACKLPVGSTECFDQHVNLSMDSGSLTFVCQVCSFKSTSKHRMRYHIKLHTGDRRFTCPHCPFKATNPGTLKNHVWTVHEGLVILYLSITLPLDPVVCSHAFLAFF